MNILITGGAGFIGSHLCDKLLESGHRVICIDNLSTGNMSNLDDARKFGGNMVFLEGDVNRREELANVFKYHSIDAVYHYAAVVGVKRTLEYPFAVMDDIEGIKNILELSLQYGIKKVVYSSSSEVYGEPLEIPTREDSYINPGLTYAAVKLIGERYCRAYFEKHNLRVSCLRLFNVYGPRQNSSLYGFVVGILISRAIKNEDMIIYGDGSQTRDFTYISDVVNSSERVLDVDNCGGEAINIGTGIRTSILSLTESIIKLTNSGSKIKYLPKRANDILHRCAEIKKMAGILGYIPQCDLKKGLEYSIKWYKVYNNANFKN
jgi:UDP-glucuronate decarboxylase